MAALAPHSVAASARAAPRAQLLVAMPRPRSSLVRRCASAATAETEVVAVAPGQVHSVSASTLPAVLEAAKDTPVLVDVYTQWCGPCKMIAPELEKMASEDFKDNVIFTKIDCTSINENKKWAMAQNVKALPTFILYKNGQRVADMTGAKVAALRKLIETHL